MEEQYVYVARLENHFNKFMDGYYKLGMTKQYTIRETQLNSTHLPIDVRMARVFKTDDMVVTETILKTCFIDYRVIKKYRDGTQKKTEWFYVDDEEILYGRIDKIIALFANIVEIDLEDDIKKDPTISQEEKEELIKTFRKSKTRLGLVYNGEDMTQDNSTDTFLLTLKLISEQSGWDKIMEHEIRVTKAFEELRDRNPSASDSQLKHYEGHYIFTGNNNEVKLKNLNKIIRRLNIKNVNVSIKK
jgi:hypothetical protein